MKGSLKGLAERLRNGTVIKHSVSARVLSISDEPFKSGVPVFPAGVPSVPGVPANNINDLEKSSGRSTGRSRRSTHDCNDLAQDMNELAETYGASASSEGLDEGWNALPAVDSDQLSEMTPEDWSRLDAEQAPAAVGFPDEDEAPDAGTIKIVPSSIPHDVMVAGLLKAAAIRPAVNEGPGPKGRLVKGLLHADWLVCIYRMESCSGFKVYAQRCDAATNWRFVVHDTEMSETTHRAVNDWTEGLSTEGRGRRWFDNSASAT